MTAPTPARLHCAERRQLGKITAKAFASAVFHYPFSEAAMSLLNSPDPAVRAAIVQQDLGNVLHPIVQHKALETKQMVVTNELMGGGYHSYFVNSGSEANEAGFKIARQYQKHERPGEFRFKTISRYYAYRSHWPFIYSAAEACGSALSGRAGRSIT